MTTTVASRPLWISIARMHHISNPSKFRRLKRFAEHDNISGLVKAGKPGVLVFDGHQDTIKAFLEHARGLRYLDFHHVETKLLGEPQEFRLADGWPGLHEVKGMNELLQRLDSIGEKQWFRAQMGMSKG